MTDQTDPMPQNSCSETNPCDDGDGDCFMDTECKGDMVCGWNNCPQLEETDDCCTKP
jgi:hypothetical protein